MDLLCLELPLSSLERERPGSAGSQALHGMETVWGSQTVQRLGPKPTAWHDFWESCTVGTIQELEYRHYRCESHSRGRGKPADHSPFQFRG